MCRSDVDTSSHQNSSGHQENRPSQHNTPTAGHADQHNCHKAPWRTVELSHTAAEDRGYVTAYGGSGVNSAMHGYSASPAPAQTSKEGHRQLPQHTRPEDAGREHAYAGEHVADIMHGQSWGGPPYRCPRHVPDAFIHSTRECRPGSRARGARRQPAHASEAR